MMRNAEAQDKTYRFRLSERLLDRFTGFCEARQCNPAAVIRAALTTWMDEIETGETAKTISPRGRKTA
jgi:hypothetical protein